MPVDKKPLEALLKRYTSTWAEGLIDYRGIDREYDKEQLDLFSEFLHAHENPFVRECIPGHFTGSAIVVDPSLEKVLLTHHRKLEKWLQLGGHADGDINLEDVAFREVQEESGIDDVTFLDYEKALPQTFRRPVPFDLDRHVIPERKQEPEHFHYDLRFLIVANDPKALTVSEESYDVRWFTLDEARKMTDEESMLRQFNKFEALRSALSN